MTWGETRKVALMLLSKGDYIYQVTKGINNSEWLIKREIQSIDHFSNTIWVCTVGMSEYSGNIQGICKISDLYYDIKNHSYYVYKERIKLPRPEKVR